MKPAPSPRSGPIRLRIGGIVPFSTVDYPGWLSAVVFCHGCTWRCRYCHNPHLREGSSQGPTWEEFEAFLVERRGQLEAVVFSGGEPLAQPDLERAMRAARGHGYQIGLHTAGTNPDRLRHVLPLVNWVGFDVKAPFDDRYVALTGCKNSPENARRSLEILLASGVAYEVRTTVHPLLLDADGQDEIRRALARAGSRPTRWQKFRPDGCADPELTATPELPLPA